MEMENKRRMSRRLGWLRGTLMLVGIGLLVACGSNYSPSSDGLILVASQGSGVVESFSFSLSSGSIQGITNTPSSTGATTCGLPGLPSFMVMDPAGAYAYVILTVTDQCPNTKTGIASFKVNSDGTVGSLIGVTADPNPMQIVMDPSGKYLFVAEGIKGLVNAYGVNNGNLTAVSNTFNFVNGTGFQSPNITAIAVTSTVLPGNGINGQQNSVCSDLGNSAPTTEYLYATDSVNNVVWEFLVDTSSGALGNLKSASQVQFVTAGSIPTGIAVDPCDRFVYVANNQSNNVSAYSICDSLNTSNTQLCPTIPPGSLLPVTGSPFALTSGANGPGPLQVDPFGNYLYVLDTKSNQVSPFKIAQLTGSLTSQNVVETGLEPTALAIRGDDNWLFVTNFNAATVSEFSITPSTGNLSPLPPIQVDNWPWGIAVK
jgi:6-phosphogluconolactonase